jgi:endonuclease-3
VRAFGSNAREVNSISTVGKLHDLELPAITGRLLFAPLPAIILPHMGKSSVRVPELLDDLEAFHGPLEPAWPTDPYLFLVWWYCGYPASDSACSKGWESLNRGIGTGIEQLLAASPASLAKALKPGGMVPEIRAMRLKELAARVKDHLGGDLRGALAGPIAQARSTLKKFHSIADPGADRILLFAGLAPVAAVPSNCPYVLVRIQRGLERENYGVTYREAQEAIAAEVPEKFDARIRAYLLLKRHGQEICKSSKPKCEQCPVRSACAFFAGQRRGRAGGVLRPRP